MLRQSFLSHLVVTRIIGSVASISLPREVWVGVVRARKPQPSTNRGVEAPRTSRISPEKYSSTSSMPRQTLLTRWSDLFIQWTA